MNIKTNKSKIIEKDIVELYSGDIWNFQLLMTVLFLVPTVTYSLHFSNILFLAPPVSYTCLDNVTNSSEAMKNVCPCENPEYDRSTFEETIIMTWNLICNRQWLVSVAQTCFQLGIMAGSIVFGFLSDSIGRKKSFIIGQSIQLIAGISLAFVTEFWMFAFLRFFIGMSIGNYLGVSFVLLMEVTTKSKRDLVSIIYRLPVGLGSAALALFAYYFRHWRHLEIALTLPIILLYLFAWALTESPRWSLAKGRNDEAIATIKKMAKINGFSSDGVEEAVKLFDEDRRNQMNDTKSRNILDLLRYPNLRNRLIILCFAWMCISFLYLGIKTYIGQLSGNIFMNVAVFSLMSYPGQLSAFILTKYSKRRFSIILTTFLAAVCMFTMTVFKIFSEDSSMNVILACFGYACISTAFTILYLSTAELISTEVRNAAFGITGVFSKLGAIAATFVAYFEVFGVWVPSFNFGIVAFVAAILSYFLAETKGKALMTIIKKDDKKKDLK